MGLAASGRVDQTLVKLSRFLFYLPGASLRGVWRSWLERALRNHETPGQPKICNPFEEGEREPERSCSKALEKASVPYSRSCPVCRLFGCTAQSGRLDISDAELDAKRVPNILVRDQVSINRKTGSVERKYQIYALENATFNVTLRLRNFELQQLHLLGMMVAEISRIAIGSGKGKGFGLFNCAYVSGTLRYFGSQPVDNAVRGIGEDPVWGREFCAKYGIAERTPQMLAGPGWTAEKGSLYRFSRSVSEAEFQQIWQGIELDFGSVRTLAQNRANGPIANRPQVANLPHGGL
jgi:CRISPR/Cas system CSM-associated protein Csm3 (group 7 of RAMP superfamily)